MCTAAALPAMGIGRRFDLLMASPTRLESGGVTLAMWPMRLPEAVAKTTAIRSGPGGGLAAEATPLEAKYLPELMLGIANWREAESGRGGNCCCAGAPVRRCGER